MNPYADNARAAEPLTFSDRLLVAFDALLIRFDDAGRVTEADVQDVAAAWTVTPRECPIIDHDDYHVLRDALTARLLIEAAAGSAMVLSDEDVR